MSQPQTSVNGALTRRRPSRYVESIDFLAMVRRIVRAAGNRVGGEDVNELKALVAIRSDLDDAIFEAVRGLRASGHTWGDIGDVQGVTKQAAEQWFHRRAGTPE